MGFLKSRGRWALFLKIWPIGIIKVEGKVYGVSKTEKVCMNVLNK